jgi:hypothetical protein
MHIDPEPTAKRQDYSQIMLHRVCQTVNIVTSNSNRNLSHY